MYINNGIAVDAGWTKSIAWSVDGLRWNTLNKHNLTVRKAVTNGNVNSPLVKELRVYTLTISDGDFEVLKFNLDEIKNQPGWTVDDAGLIQAIDDLSTWISV